MQATTHPSRKYEIIKCSMSFVSSMYADAAFTLAAPKYWNSIPDELRTISYIVTFKCRLYIDYISEYIHICYHYNVLF